MNCQMEVPIGMAQDCNSDICSRYAIHRCCDCGIAICREHEHPCCGEYWCEFCLEVHQHDEHNIPAEEIFAA